MKDLAGQLRSLFGFSQWRRKRAQLPFDLLFKRFRDVLDAHNRGIEIITEMGETLGGDYLFDINYISSSYSRLFTSVQECLQYFDALTQNRYPDLMNAVRRIDDQITRVIFDVTSPSDRDIVFYEYLKSDMSRETGGKNAALAELKNNLGVNIPEAFAITAHAFDEFMAYNGLTEKIASLRKEGNTAEHELAGLRKNIMESRLPPNLETEMSKALTEVVSRCGKNASLAVRSSAEDEDGEFSFAGQFETILNVPVEMSSLEEAYKKVIASLFTANAMSYQKRLGYDIGELRMAVACMVLVEAASSGVIYTVRPADGANEVTISSVWGLGAAVVEGQTGSDIFIVDKVTGEIKFKRISEKLCLITARNGGGTIKTEALPTERNLPSLTTEQVKHLTEIAVSIERYFHKPQDIEWAIDKEGVIFILQARPLKLVEDGERRTGERTGAEGHRVLIRNTGEVVCRGTGAGKVFIIRKMEEIANFPKGAVLVARNDSSNFVRLMPYASAIVTDTGSPTSHMASLSREFRVPTLVNTGDATGVLRHGQEVTVDIDENDHAVIYDGIVRELVESAYRKTGGMDEVFEYRKKRYLLKFVSPLNLIDPLTDDFTPGKCKTIHDILRFIHEKSVAELVENARYSNSILKKHAAVKLELEIPAGIMVIDIGGGLNREDNSGSVTYDQVVSTPLKAIIRGMLHPGIWHSEAIPLKVNDFLSSMMRMSDIVTDNSEYVGYNVAVISAEYLNLSLRFGYHFNMLDCYCTKDTRNNHIYFRFVGGATDISKRTRRVELIASILKEFGFTIRFKGDLITARIANISHDEMERTLDQLGRLIGYTRQLDAVLHDDAAVERYSKDFLKGRYDT